MDVIKPSLIWVEDRCYRTYKENTNHEDTNLKFADDKEITINNGENIATNTEVGSYSTTLHIPKQIIGFLMGKNGSTKKHIEYDTKTNINVNSSFVDGDNIVINGRKNEMVLLAKGKIINIINKGRKSFSSTHFVSIPIATEDIVNRYLEFKGALLKKHMEDRGIHESIFPKAHKLHLTIEMLTLLDDVELTDCIKILKDCYKTSIKDIIGNQPIKVHIKGIEYMNDDPSEVDVLYAKVDPFQDLDRLQTLADHVIDRLVAEGLVTRPLYNLQQKVKLHMTIMNTRYRRGDQQIADDSRPAGNSATTANRFNDRDSLTYTATRDRETFDARNILKNYAQYDFGSITVDSLHLSSRFATGKDGYYLPAMVIPLRTNGEIV